MLFRKSNKIIVSLLFVVFLVGYTSAQEKIQISGYVKDSVNSERLIGASVKVKGRSLGGVCDLNGYFSFFVEKGDYTIEVSFVGYRKKEIVIQANEDIRYMIYLSSQSQNLSEITIVGQKANEYIEQVAPGVHTLKMKELKQLPQVLGETDPLKVIQLLPGVQASGEGNTGFYVRGGGMDQNLLLFDGVALYNVGHLFGFFSIFNSNIIEDVTVIKAGMPANYGSRLASVVDINSKSGDLNKYVCQGGMGLLSSNITIEGPIKKNSSSFILSARRTYIDGIVGLGEKIVSLSKEYDQNYFFYDINLKLYQKLGSKDVLHISAYTGKDNFEYNDLVNDYFENKMLWGNNFASLKWNHIFNKKLYFSLISGVSDYRIDYKAGLFSYEILLNTRINDFFNKWHFDYTPNSKHKIKYGMEHVYHIIMPNNVSAELSNDNFRIQKVVRLNSQEISAFINDEYQLNNKLSIQCGVRYSLFQQLGPFDRYLKNEYDLNIDTLKYEKNKVIQTYQHPEPRFSFRYMLNDNKSFKGGFAQNYQYIHLAPMSSVSLPTDVWVPSSQNIKPQFGNQYTIGYFQDFKSDTFEFSVETYYKSMENLLEYQEGIVSITNFADNYDQIFYFGSGRSFGLELYMRKKKGDLTGWISYSLSKSIRQFDEIQNGEPFYAKHDRRHDLSITGKYEINKKWSASVVFVYASGNALTLPVSRYLIQGNIINKYSKRNIYRMPAYHRMDVSLTYTAKKTSKWESEWNFSVYNIYNRQNPYYIFFRTTGKIRNYSLQVHAKQVSLFPILPSVSWCFKF